MWRMLPTIVFVLMCQAATAAPVIGVSWPGDTTHQWKVDSEAIRDAISGGSSAVIETDARLSAAKQILDVISLIDAKVDVLIVVAVDARALETPIKAAVAAGIPVIGSNTRVNSDLLSAYVGSDDRISGYMEAKIVLDKIGCKGNVVIIEGPIGQSAQIQRLEGNKKALAECPDVKVLEDQTANWSRAEAQKLMENWLTAHPGQIQGVIGQNDEMALGAIEAIKAAGNDV